MDYLGTAPRILRVGECVLSLGYCKDNVNVGYLEIAVRNM